MYDGRIAIVLCRQNISPPKRVKRRYVNDIVFTALTKEETQSLWRDPGSYFMSFRRLVIPKPDALSQRHGVVHVFQGLHTFYESRIHDNDMER